MTDNVEGSMSAFDKLLIYVIFYHRFLTFSRELKLVTVTQKAAEKLKELLKEDAKENGYLRVFVQGGGCSGFQYGLMIEETPNDADQIIESSGIKIAVDPVSISYLKGAEVDYIDSVSGGGFSIKNPNASSTCGCGQSFKTEE